MPIRLNLLAEAQALVEARRRDPVKRAIQVGAVIVALLLAWSAELFIQAMLIRTNLARVERNVNSSTDTYKTILANQAKLGEIRGKLEALNRLTANRFLIGNLLNTLQQTAVENVQVTVLRIEQTYTFTPEIKPTAAAEGDTPVIKTYKPATTTEKIVVTIGAKDSGPNPGDQVSKFQKALSNTSYFENLLVPPNEFRLARLDQVETTPTGQRFLNFTLEGRVPPKTR
jgi:hypothetical protein